MNSRLSREIKAEAKRLGFFACGIAKAEPVDADTQRHVREWVSKKDYAGMEYMANNLEKRLDPTLLVPGTKSIISVALNYAPKVVIDDSDNDKYHFAAYALGKDYHDIIKKRLRLLANKFNWKELSANETTPNSTEDSVAVFRCFVDSAPVLERYWAWRTGIGEFCHNNLISVPGYGPTVFLGEIFAEQEFDHYDLPICSPPQEYSGWESLCPALTPDGLDARLCLSYQTIENRGELPADVQLRRTFYGCDRCLRACPQFKESHPTAEEAFQPSSELLNMQQIELEKIIEDNFNRIIQKP